jgi:16S rRNA (guanine527-N7)-methyltransferase
MTAAERELLARGAVELGSPLTEEQIDLFARMVAELLRWNRRINLTAITDVREIIGRHLLDSLSVRPFLDGTETLLDIGSGAGFPGFPLKVALPGIRLWSVDAVAKKVAFQAHLGRLLGFRDIHPLHLRLDGTGSGGIPPCRVVTARALAESVAIARLARPCLMPGGRLILMKSEAGRGELERSEPELARLGFRMGRCRELSLPVTGDRRLLAELLLTLEAESAP